MYLLAGSLAREKEALVEVVVRQNMQYRIKIAAKLFRFSFYMHLFISVIYKQELRYEVSREKSLYNESNKIYRRNV